MAGRPWLAGLLAMCLAACKAADKDSATVADSGVAVASIRAPASIGNTKAGPAVERLHDSAWNTVNVEVRTGNYQNCDQNASLGTRVLHRGETWTVSTFDNRICWRRDADPDHANGSWTTWTARDVFTDHQYDDNI
jgi:hypothetical protein